MSAPHDNLDVAIVGAGPAGLGLAVVLRSLGIDDIVVLERSQVGATFHSWPRQMRLLTPSFTSNQFGLPDLNAVTYDTSPALGFRREHLSGAEYADYLARIVRMHELPVRAPVEVAHVEPDDRGFVLTTTAGRVHSRFVVWAAGEYRTPRLDGLPGSEHGLHNAHVDSWDELPPGDVVVVGGFESGIDAAVHLVDAGRFVTVVDRGSKWKDDGADPSRALSPFTHERLDRALRTDRLTLVGETEVTGIDVSGDGFTVRSRQGGQWQTALAPVLATGFHTGLTPVAGLFDWRDETSSALLTEDGDESTRTPGLFLVGPEVRHDDAIFCFIYKFRQRFAVVATQIALRLDVDPAPLDELRDYQMFLADLSCCGGSCAC